MQFQLLTRPYDPILQAYLESGARVSIIRGPLGSGKTFTSCHKIFNIMCQQRPNRQGIRKSRVIAIRNTYPDLLSTTIKDWREIFDDLGRFKMGNMEPPSHRLSFRLHDKTRVEAELLFVALDRPQAVKKLRGVQATLFWLNELKELEKAIVDHADLRHGRYPSPLDGGCSFHGMIGDTNSPDDDHWLYDAETNPPPGWAFFAQPGGLRREFIVDELGKQIWTGNWLPNPDAENIHNLPVDYYEAGKANKSTEWIAVNLANEYGTIHDGKPIYGEQWSPELHISSTITLLDNWPIIVGLDFGLTPSAIIGQETPRGAIHILEELVSDGMGIKQFCEHLLLPTLRGKYKSNDWNFVGDPAGNRRADTDENTVFKELSSLGIHAEAANTNNPTIRWEAVRYYMQQLRDGKPAFKVHSDCKILIKGFNGGYKWRRLQIPGTEKYHHLPDKNKFSHPHDALQYLCMWLRGDTGDDNNDFERPEVDRWAQ